MIPTVSISKKQLNNLPEEVLSLIGMGKYTLYQVEMEGRPNVRYVLRTGERELFFLKENGEVISFENAKEFNILKKVTIDGVFTTSVVPNFNLS